MSLYRTDRAPWADRFTKPNLEQLRRSLPATSIGVFDALRARLLREGELTESIAWRGVPWRWCLIYQSVRTDEGNKPQSADRTHERAWAYIVPDPENLQICLPLHAEHIQLIDTRRLKKWVREGIVFARSVGGVCWPTYQLTTESQLDELIELVDRKSEACAARAGVIAV